MKRLKLMKSSAPTDQTGLHHEKAAFGFLALVLIKYGGTTSR